MEVSLTEYYYEQLKKSSNKVQIMVAFFKALFGLDSVNKDLYQSFGRLIKIYGDDVVYFSILDCVEVNNIDLTNVTRLISYFAKKRLQEKYVFDSAEDLSDLAKKNLKEMEKKKRLKIPEVFDE